MFFFCIPRHEDRGGLDALFPSDDKSSYDKLRLIILITLFHIPFPAIFFYSYFHTIFLLKQRQRISEKILLYSKRKKSNHHIVLCTSFYKKGESSPIIS